MPTQFSFRLTLIVPAAKVAAVVTWFQNNIGVNSVPSDLGPGLSATGTAPATHVWCSGAYQDSEAKAILAKLCQLASVTPPTAGQWAGWNRAQKIAWLRGVRASLWSGYGVWVQLSPNDGDWDHTADALASTGLMSISEA